MSDMSEHDARFRREGWVLVEDEGRKLDALMCLTDENGMRHSFGEITDEADFTGCGLYASDMGVVDEPVALALMICERCRSLSLEHKLWASHEFFSAPDAVGPASGADATSLSAKKGSATNER